MSTLSDFGCEVAAAPQASSLSRGGVGERLRAWINERLPGAALLSILDQAVVSGTSFATSVIIGRACGRAELGVYYLALSVLLFIAALQGDLISAPFLVYSHRRQGKALSSYLAGVLLHQNLYVLLAVATLLVILGASAWYGASFELLTVLAALLAALPFLLWRQFVRYQSFAQLQFGAALAMDAGIALLQVGGLLTLALGGLLTVARAYAVMGGCCGLISLAWLWVKPQPWQFRWRRALVVWRQNWSFGRWALTCRLVNDAARFVTPWIVAVLHGEAATGLLAACNNIVNIAGTYVTGIDNQLTPRAARAYARGGAAALWRVLWKTGALLLVTVGLFCLVMLVAGGLVARFIFGNQYGDCGPIVATLSLATLANSVGITVGNGLWAIDRPKTNLLGDVATLIVTFGALACLASWGVLGAALAMCLGAVAGAGVRCLTLCKLLAQIQEPVGCPSPATPFPGEA